MAVFGYARVSTTDQSPDSQIDVLEGLGAEKVWVEYASGANSDRPELASLLGHLRAGDTLAVWRLDRLGRSLRDLIELVNELNDREIALQSVQEQIDTSTPTGRLIMHIFGALAEFERNLMIERTQAGLAAARARGRNGGRPAALDQKQLAKAQSLYDKGETITYLADHFGVSRSTLYRHLDTSGAVAVAPVVKRP